MENNLHIDFKAHEEISDTLSTSAASGAFEETSPSHADGENDIQAKSRRIRKKRDAYKKIDDEIRLHLLEAVQRGETLKSAAKRYQVNYSSAKSIFHIYRKEGRILKKATQEKDLPMTGIPNMNPMSQMSQMSQMNTMNTINAMNSMNAMNVMNTMNTMNPMNAMGTGLQIPLQFPTNPTQIPQIPMIPFYQRSIFPQSYIPQGLGQDRVPNNGNEANGCSSPLNGLVDNFSELLKIGTNMNPKDDMAKQKSFIPTNPSRFMPRVTSPTNQTINKMQPHQQQIIIPQKSANNPGFGSPAERNKQLDNFYMNYSNSPLSGNARMMKEGSESGSNRNVQSEFDSFSDMVSAFQSQNHLTNTIKERKMSKFMTPTTGTPKEKNERRMSSEEEVAWNGNIENAALDTYKSFLDAQMVLSNAFMKASVLNNMVQMQKTKMDGSPSSKFLNFIGN